jgi:hypothetical protein
MKKNLSVILAMMLMAMRGVEACEICGCGVNNYYIGILPQFTHKFFGVRYHFNSFRTQLLNDPSQFSKDFYQTIEIWGGWNIGKKFQVLALVPMNFNHQNSDEGITNHTGPGDIVLLVNYKVFDTRSGGGINNSVSQDLWIGGGIKLPTGKFEIEQNDPDVASMANGQLGSGSSDVLVNAMYNIHLPAVGISTTVSYKANSGNKYDYKFGNKFSAGSFIYYPKMISKSIVSPNLGILYEHTKKSILQNSKIDLTSGLLLQASAGIEVSFSNVAVGFNVQLPVAQNFAENQTREKIKGMLHVSLAL